MAETFDEIPIDQVAEGDIVDGVGEPATSAKVVFKDASADAILVTFEADNGETFEVRYSPGTVVRRFPEAKWGSAQSPTPHVT